MQANLSVANAYVADFTPPADRARRFGMLGAMFGVGFILGPVMGGLLGAIDLRLPFLSPAVWRWLICSMATSCCRSRSRWSAGMQLPGEP